MRSKALVAAVFLALLGQRFAAAANRPAPEQEKIDYLLAQVRGSDAVFIRNGTEHDGPAAAAHLKSKLWWAGKRVQTARDFILGVASHSEQTGKPYEIRPRNAPARPLRDWLLARLAEREKAAATPSQKGAANAPRRP
jgi:hypothetical protein